MKKKYLALMLGAVLTFSSVSAMAAENVETTAAEAVDTDEADEDTVIYGEVKSLGEDSITIAPGTLKYDDDQTEEDASEADDETQEAQPEEEDLPDVLEIEDEEQTVLITEDTLFYRNAEAPDAEEELGDDQDQTETEEKTEEENAGEASEILIIDLAGVEEADMEEISFSDLSEGDVLAISLGADGEAETVIVLRKAGPALDEIVVEEAEEDSEE